MQQQRPALLIPLSSREHPADGIAAEYWSKSHQQYMPTRVDYEAPGVFVSRDVKKGGRLARFPMTTVRWVIAKDPTCAGEEKQRRHLLTSMFATEVKEGPHLIVLESALQYRVSSSITRRLTADIEVVQIVDESKTFAVHRWVPSFDEGLSLKLIHSMDVATRCGPHPHLLTLDRVQWGWLNDQQPHASPSSWEVQAWRPFVPFGTLNTLLSAWAVQVPPAQSTQVIESLIVQLLEACRFLEENSTLHGNLKPAHILVNKNMAAATGVAARWQVMVTDFGTSEFLSDEVPRAETLNGKTRVRRSEMESEYPYHPWEMYTPYIPVVAFSTDMFSLGLILYEIGVGRPFFDDLMNTYGWTTLHAAFHFLRTGKPPQAEAHGASAYSSPFERTDAHPTLDTWSDASNFVSKEAEDSFLQKLVVSMGRGGRVPSSFWKDQLVPLVVGLLRWNPHARLTALAALQMWTSPRISILRFFRPLQFRPALPAWDSVRFCSQIPLAMLPHRKLRTEMLLILTTLLTRHPIWSKRTCRTFFLVATWMDRTFVVFDVAAMTPTVRHLYLLALLWLSGKVLREEGETKLLLSDALQRGDWAPGIGDAQFRIWTFHLQVTQFLDGHWMPDGTACWHVSQRPLHLLELWLDVWDVTSFWAQLRTRTLMDVSPQTFRNRVESHPAWTALCKRRPTEEVPRAPDQQFESYFRWTLSRVLWEQRDWVCWSASSTPTTTPDDPSSPDWSENPHLLPEWKEMLKQQWRLVRDLVAPEPESAAYAYHSPEKETRREARAAYLAVPRDTPALRGKWTVRQKLISCLGGRPPAPFEAVEKTCHPGDLKQQIGGGGAVAPPNPSSSSPASSSCALYPRQRFQAVLTAVLDPYPGATFIKIKDRKWSPSASPVLLERDPGPQGLSILFDLRVNAGTGSTTPPGGSSTLDSPLTPEFDYYLDELFFPSSSQAGLPFDPHMELKLDVSVTFASPVPAGYTLAGWNKRHQGQWQRPEVGWISTQWHAGTTPRTWRLTYWMNSGQDVPRTQWAERLPLKRLKVVEEMMVNERTYVYRLYTCLDLYFLPVGDVTRQQKAWQAFGKLIRHLADVHHGFLDHLNQATSLHEVADVMHHTFTYHLLGLYSHYAAQFNTLIKELLKTWKEPALETRGPTGLNLGAYLILPIQQLPRYELLLREIQGALRKWYHEQDQSQQPPPVGWAAWEDGHTSLRELEDVENQIHELMLTFNSLIRNADDLYRTSRELS